MKYLLLLTICFTSCLQHERGKVQTPPKIYDSFVPAISPEGYILNDTVWLNNDSYIAIDSLMVKQDKGQSIRLKIQGNGNQIDIKQTK